MLFEAGANVNAKSTFERIALHVAAEKGHHRAIPILLVAGGDVDAKMVLDVTALRHTAVMRVIKVLLATRADMNVQTKNGHTARCFVALMSHQNVVNRLRGKSRPVKYKQRTDGIGYGNGPGIKYRSLGEW